MVCMVEMTRMNAPDRKPHKINRAFIFECTNPAWPNIRDSNSPPTLATGTAAIDSTARDDFLLRFSLPRQYLCEVTGS